MTRRRGSQRRIVLGSALALTALLTVSACSGDDEPDAGATGSSSSSSSGSSTGTDTPSTEPGLTTAQQLTQQILSETDSSPALVTVTGTVEAAGGRKSPVSAEILEVRTNAETTLLRWRLKSASGASVPTFGGTLSRAPLFDTRGVTVIDKTAKQALSPFTYSDDDRGCVCSDMPQTVDGTGEPMYGLYPALGASSATVDVKLPGFAVAKGVKVTRS